MNGKSYNLNILDNQYTRKYKLAVRTGVPVNFININSKGYSKTLLDETKFYKGTVEEIIYFSKKYNTTALNVIYFLYENPEKSDLEIINEALSNENVELVSDLHTFTENRNNWLLSYQGWLMENLRGFSDIHSVQQKLLTEYSSPKTFNVTYSKSTMVYNVLPSVNFQIYWDINSVFDIIDNSISSQQLPFMHSIHEGKHIFKIFFSEEIEYIHDPEVFFSFTKEKYQQDKIYMYIWNGRNVNLKNSYNECILDVSSGLIEVNSNISSDNDDIESVLQSILRNIDKSLPFFRLINGEVQSVNARLTYPNVKVNMDILYFMMDQDPIFSSYFTLFETTNIRSSERKTLVAYNNIIPDTSQAFLKFSSKLEDNVSYLVINITRARNSLEVEEIGALFDHLLLYYKDKHVFYKEFLLRSVGDVSATDKVEFEIPASKGKMLTKLAPEVFDMDEENVSYNRNICQNIKQPIIIDDDEIDSWTKMTVKGKPRTVAEFPPPREGVKKMFNYVCPNDDYSHPTLTENKFSENREQYPMLPCCGNEDRYTEYVKYGTGKISEYYKPRESYQKYRIVSNKNPIKETYFGWLPTVIRSHLDMSSNISDYIQNINKLLRNKRQRDEESSAKTTGGDAEDETEEGVSTLSLFMRYSVGQESDSFISCVLHAVGSEERPMDVRRKMSELNLSLYAQENLHLTDDGLREQILTGYIDPLLLYRGLEELYDVNIFMFDNRTNEILLPYFKVSHIRNLRQGRKCVLIWYYPAKKVSELIVKLEGFGKNNKRNAQKVFDEEVGKRMHITMQKIYSAWMENFYLNILSALDWGSAKNGLKSSWTFVSQKLDQNKKCRGFTVRNREGNSPSLVVYTPPTQPLNLPTDNFDTTLRTTYTIAVAFIGKDAYSKTNDGVWFSVLEIDEMLFVPISDADSIDLPMSKTVSPVVYNEHVKQILENDNNMTKVSSDIVNLIWWLFLIENNKRITVDNWKKWWEKNTKLEKDINVSYSYVEKLALVSSSEEGIEYSHKFYPEIFKDGKIYVTEKSKYSIGKLLEQKTRENSGLTLPIPTFISKKYSNEKDFGNNYCKVFLSRNNLDDWVSAVSNIKNYKNFVSTIDEIPNNEISYIKYRTHIYIVQRENSTREAVYNSYQFSKSKINLHSKYGTVPSDKYPYISYALKAGKLLVYEDHSEGASEYGEIIEDIDSVYSLLRVTEYHEK